MALIDRPNVLNLKLSHVPIPSCYFKNSYWTFKAQKPASYKGNRHPEFIFCDFTLAIKHINFFESFLYGTFFS